MRRQLVRCLARIASAAVLLIGPLGGDSARAADFHESFDGGEPTWRLGFDKAQLRVQGHRRQTEVFQAGTGSEHVAFVAAQSGVPVWLEHRIGPARVLDELKLMLQVRSPQPGATVYLRVTFPHERNPVSGEPLTALVPGDAYSNSGRWQQLTCTTTDKQLRELAQRLRQRLNKPLLNLTEAYVDRAYLAARLPAGTTELYVDELHLSPVVEPREPTLVAASIEQAEEPFPVELRLGRLLLEGAPFFPRITPYHGEQLEILKLTGVDVVWVPDSEDEALLGELRRHSLWATATPPGIAAEDGTVIDLKDVSMLPFTGRTRSILFWNLGTRVPADRRDDVAALMTQIQSADRRFKRPVMVDIIGGQERAISRDVDLLAVSRHVCNTGFDARRYRDWLVQRQMLAQQGKFFWTWIQTEPATAAAERRAAAQQHPIVIEPEQIRLQLYAALAAGCRGIGFFKTTPLDGDRPGDLERRLMLAQLNLELELLEPWLATGRVEAQVPFEVEQKPVAPITRRSLDFQNSSAARRERDALIRQWQDRQKRQTQIGTELEAAIIKSDFGTLLLPIWYEHDAQFVPGQMAANNATIVVPGVPDTALAYEVSTTNIQAVMAQDQKRVPGGMKIVLPRFEQTAAVLVTSDRAVVDRLRQKQAELAESSAQISVELARAKLARVREVDAELRALGAGLTDSADLLAGATHRADVAEEALRRGNYHTAREFAGEAMQFLRILQRAFWDDAVRDLAFPVSSPHTVCFQTLPDHWRMMARLARSRTERAANLLPSGDFEDPETMIAAGWQHAQNAIEAVRANADLPAGKEGKLSLRLMAFAEAGREVPAVLPRSPVIVTTPAVAVRSGQLVEISGWVRVGSPISGSLDGTMLYDSLTGPGRALRWDARTGWQPFRLIREAHETGDLTLTIVLNGLGEIRFDDLRIVAHDPIDEAPPPTAAPPEEKNPFSPLQFLERLPRLPRSAWDWRQ